VGDLTQLVDGAGYSTVSREAIASWFVLFSTLASMGSPAQVHHLPDTGIYSTVS